MAQLRIWLCRVRLNGDPFFEGLQVESILLILSIVVNVIFPWLVSLVTTALDVVHLVAMSIVRSSRSSSSVVGSDLTAEQASFLTEAGL